MTLEERVEQLEKTVAELREIIQPTNPELAAKKNDLTMVVAAKFRAAQLISDPEQRQAALADAEEHYCSLRSLMQQIEAGPR